MKFGSKLRANLIYKIIANGIEQIVKEKIKSKQFPNQPEGGATCPVPLLHGGASQQIMMRSGPSCALP